jgi:hypothetical protein
VDGDYYLDVDTGDVYRRVAGVYGVVANIEGPTGPTGPIGPAGPAGPAGDSGGSVTLVNDEVSSVVIGTPVYSDVSGGFKKARANAIGTKSVVGLVRSVSIAAAASGLVQVSGSLVATTGQWDVVMGTSGGLAVGVRYYLSAAVAGLGTATAPITAGQYVVEIGIALSSTELKLTNMRPILL